MHSLPPLFRCLALLLLLVAGHPGRAQGPVNYADWKLEWAEEFNQATDTTALAARWRFAFPWGRNLLNNPETEYYSGVGVRVDAAGALNLVATRLQQPISYLGRELRYSSGMLLSHHPVDSLRPGSCPPDADGFSYGLFEVRCRQPADGSSFPAFWLWGGAPDEIDVFEANREQFSSTIHLGGHRGFWRPSRTRADECACFFHNTDPAGDLHEQYHTYGLAWMPNELVFYYDGVPIRHETRLVPAGCAMFVIVNLAMWNWSSRPADTLAVDYIRIYRPRRVPPPVAVVRRGGEAPQPELNWLPLEWQPGRLDPGRVQGWQARPARGNRLNLQLTDNLNPPCDVDLPLPVNGRWAPPWVVVDNVPAQRLAFEKTDSVAWRLADALGRVVAQGVAPGTAPWQPRWPALPPGSYVLHLRQGRAETTHPVQLLGRTARDAEPQEAWRRVRELPAELPE